MRSDATPAEIVPGDSSTPTAVSYWLNRDECWIHSLEIRSWPRWELVARVPDGVVPAPADACLGGKGSQSLQYMNIEWGCRMLPSPDGSLCAFIGRSHTRYYPTMILNLQLSKGLDYTELRRATKVIEKQPSGEPVAWTFSHDGRRLAILSLMLSERDCYEALQDIATFERLVSPEVLQCREYDTVSNQWYEANHRQKELEHQLRLRVRFPNVVA
ncbi:MAG: hypothetical protein ACE5PV_13915 [Candidatus Poribacteria bacterium]